MPSLPPILKNQFFGHYKPTKPSSQNKNGFLGIPIILLSLILTSPSLFSHICIDVDDYSFPSSQSKGIRVSVFNTETQAFEAIEYHSPPSVSSTRLTFLENTIPLSYPSPGLKIKFNKDIEVPENFESTKYILRTKGQIMVPQNWTMTPFIAAPYTLLYKNVTTKTPHEVIEKLRGFTGSTLTPTFNVWFQRDPKTFANISTNINENSNERGIIGELATTLTMISFGYFTKHPSQNESNQGFDGVFVDSNNNYLLLTESKCRTESETAEKYLEKEMNEREVHSKISRLASIYPSTKQLIEEFIQNKPQNIVKFVHRIKPNGHSQWACEPFKKDKYIELTLSPTTPEKDQVSLLKSIFLRSGSTTPEKALTLVLASLNLTSEQAIDILKGTPPHHEEQNGVLTPLKSQKKTDLFVSETFHLKAEASPPPTKFEDIRKQLFKEEEGNITVKAIEFNEENFEKLISNLISKGYSATKIAKMAGYKNPKGERDLGRMKNASITTKLERWGNISAALTNMQLSIEYFLQ